MQHFHFRHVQLHRVAFIEISVDLKYRQFMSLLFGALKREKLTYLGLPTMIVIFNLSHKPKNTQLKVKGPIALSALASRVRQDVTVYHHSRSLLDPSAIGSDRYSCGQTVRGTAKLLSSALSLDFKD